MTTELFLQTVVNATYAASYMALIAVGLVLIFGVMGVINFAHGELYMAGAYAVVALYAGLGMPSSSPSRLVSSLSACLGFSWNTGCSGRCATIRSEA